MKRRQLVIGVAGALAAMVATGIGRAAADGDPHADQGRPGDGRADDDDVVERAEINVAPGRRAIRAVVIDNQLGDVRVEGHDGNGVTIVSVKHAPDADTLERMRVTLVPDPDGTVRLTTALADARERRPVALGTLRLDLTIKVPRSARVDGRVGRGRLDVKNVDAGADLDAGAGSITVANVSGPVLTRSLDGDQHLDAVFGDLDAHAVDGDLDLERIRGQVLTAQVYSGGIAGRRLAARSVHMVAVRGDITIDAESQPGGTIVVSSLRGKVDVSVRAAGRLTVRARAGGHLTMGGAAEARDRWIEGQFGRAGRPGSSGSVRLESRYGDVAFSLIE